MKEYNIFQLIRSYNGLDKTAVACFAFMAIFSELAISHSDNTLYPEWSRRLYLYMMFASLVIALFKSFSYKSDSYKSVIVLPAIYFSLTTFHTNLDVTGGRIFDSLYTGLRIVLFLLLTNSGKVRVYEVFRAFLLFLSIFGIVVFISHIIGIPLPHRNVEYYTESSYARYIDYFCCILFSESGSVRLCGLFNEPGAFGTFIALVLCVDKYNLSKYSNKILLLAGICTFSVAFFLISSVYLVLKYYDNLKVMVSEIIFLALFFVILPNIGFSSQILNKFFNRFNFVDGSFVADTRSTTFIDSLLESMFSNNSLLWGYGRGYFTLIDYSSGASTYKTVLIEHGIIGFTLIYGLLIVFALKMSRRNPFAIFFVVCFSLSIYQRPFVYTLVYFIILFGGIEKINNCTKNR